MDTAPDTVLLEQWPGLSIVEQVTAGSRSSVWRADLGGRAVAVRRSKRSEPSLRWELELLTDLLDAGFHVPEPVRTSGGALQWQGWNIQSWLDGRRPTSRDDWRLVIGELRRLHRRFRNRPQRPGCSAVVELGDARRSVDADLDRTPQEIAAHCLPHFDPYLEGQRSVIHGDPGPANICIADDGRVGLIDWDEARVDICDLDLANLDIPALAGRRREVAEAAANAWEALNAWVVEPAYARRRFDSIGPPTVESEPVDLSDGTIILRPRTLTDGRAQLAGEDDEIIRWLTGGRASIERVEQHITNLQRCLLVDGMRHNFGIYTVAKPSVLTGNLDVNLADVDLEANEANLSYAVFAPWRRRGHAARAIDLAVHHLATVDPSLIPTLKIDPENGPSVGLAEKLGFRPVRTARSADENVELGIYQRPEPVDEPDRPPTIG